MAGLAVLFFEVLFADLIAPTDAQQCIAGLILLGAAPCRAMVFVWSQVTRGDPTYTVQVSVNDVIMSFAFAQIVALLIGVTDIAVPWETLILSVGLSLLPAPPRAQWLARGSWGEDAEAAVARFTAALLGDRPSGDGRAPLRVSRADHSSALFFLPVHPVPPGTTVIERLHRDRMRGQDSHVTLWESGPSRVTGIGEAKPHRRGVPPRVVANEDESVGGRR